MPESTAITGDPDVRNFIDNGNANDSWTVEKNQRCHTLIDRKIDSTITMEEAVELAELTTAMDHWIDTAAPLPLEHARKIHDSLMAKTLVDTRNGSADQ